MLVRCTWLGNVLAICYFTPLICVHLFHHANPRLPPAQAAILPVATNIAVELMNRRGRIGEVPPTAQSNDNIGPPRLVRSHLTLRERYIAQPPNSPLKVHLRLEGFEWRSDTNALMIAIAIDDGTPVHRSDHRYTQMHLLRKQVTRIKKVNRPVYPGSLEEVEVEIEVEDRVYDFNATTTWDNNGAHARPAEYRVPPVYDQPLASTSDPDRRDKASMVPHRGIVSVYLQCGYLVKSPYPGARPTDPPGVTRISSWLQSPVVVNPDQFRPYGGPTGTNLPHADIAEQSFTSETHHIVSSGGTLRDGEESTSSSEESRRREEKEGRRREGEATSLPNAQCRTRASQRKSEWDLWLHSQSTFRAAAARLGNESQ